MIPENRIPTHPLREEFLGPLGVSLTALGDRLHISVQRINEIVNGKRGITPETAWLFAGAFGTTPEFWTNLQVAHDLASRGPRRRSRGSVQSSLDGRARS